MSRRKKERRAFARTAAAAAGSDGNREPGRFSARLPSLSPGRLLRGRTRPRTRTRSIQTVWVRQGNGVTFATTRT